MDKLKPHVDKLLLTVVFLICAASTVAWTLADRTPPSWDPSHHLCAAYDYYRPLGHFDLRGFAREFFQTKHYYAPLVHLVTAGFFLIFGASKLSGIAINLLSLAVLLVSVSWIGRKLYCNADSSTAIAPASANACGIAISVLAALLTVSYHFNAWLLHDAFLDYPLMAHVTLTFALLLKADRFQSRGDAVQHDARHLDRPRVRLGPVPHGTRPHAPAHRDAAAREPERAVGEGGREPVRREGR